LLWLAVSRCQISQCFVKTRPPSLTSCQRLRDAGIVVEAQFIVGLENETGETLEETYRMARDCSMIMAALRTVNRNRLSLTRHRRLRQIKSRTE